jgi:hypothetical protein
MAVGKWLRKMFRKVFGNVCVSPYCEERGYHDHRLD